MKLLLTSSGLSNNIVKKAFLELLTKQLSQAKLAFIPTAGNPVKEEWYWKLFEQDLSTLKGLGLRAVIDVDISKVEASKWREDLHEADVIYVEGGNTFYLMDQLRRSGVSQELKGLLKDKVYVGVSAGSIIVTPDISIAGVEPADENIVGLTDTRGIGLVDFEISPHTPDMVSFDSVKRFSKGRKWAMYTIDNNSAILVKGKEILLIGSGAKKLKQPD